MTADEMSAFLSQSTPASAMRKTPAAPALQPANALPPKLTPQQEAALLEQTGMASLNTLPTAEGLAPESVEKQTRDVRDLGAALLPGATEALAIKAAPALAERTMVGALGRAAGAAPGGAAQAYLSGGNPLLGAGLGAGASMVGSLANRAAASAQKMREGGGQTMGRVMDFVNNFGERIGLGKLVNTPEEVGEVFAAEKPVGINQPKAGRSLFQRYADDMYDPFLENEVKPLWPKKGMSIPALDKFAETYGTDSLAASAQAKVVAQQNAAKNAQAALAKAQAMPANTAAQFQAKQSAIQQAQTQVQQAASPPLYDASDAIDTAAELRHKGWNPKTLEKKPGLDASLARTEGHNLVEALGQNMDKLDPSGQLSQDFYDHRTNMQKISALTKFMEDAFRLGGEDTRLGHFQRAAFSDLNNWQQLNRALGADAKPLLKILTRGVEGRPSYFDTIRPPAVNMSAGVHTLLPHIYSHLTEMIPRILRPGVQPGSIEQLLQTGIPAAILQQETGNEQ